MNDDPETSLAEINARGRAKALRRLLLSLPPIVVFLASMGFWMWIGLGLVPSIFLTSFPVIGVAIALEKLFPAAHAD